VLTSVWGHKHLIFRPQLWVAAFAIVFINLAVIARNYPAQAAVPPPARPQLPVANIQLSALAIPNAPPPDCTVDPCLALTFDDGPDPVSTPAVLAALEHARVKATFFAMGIHVAAFPQLLQRMQADGYEIGNHSWDHPHFGTLTPDRANYEIARAQEAIISAGVPAPHLFRPPYGERTVATNAAPGFTSILWNVDPRDWQEADAAKIVQSVTAQAHPGAIIILHDTHPATAMALPAILNDLARRFRLVTVSQLLGIQPGTPGAYYGR
jgi:peptidoglycan/xylan/chitin deacetylase (PgdA/CDA1 family)